MSEVDSERGVVLTISREVRHNLQYGLVVLPPDVEVDMETNNVWMGEVDLLLRGQGLPECCDRIKGKPFCRAACEVITKGGMGVLTPLFPVALAEDTVTESTKE